MKLLPAFVLGLSLALLTGGCGKRETAVQRANREGFLLLGNGAEPSDLDPQVITGTKEFNLCEALYEGLLNADPADLHPIPGVAETWETSPDGRRLTFHLRADARWSDGSPVTSADFLFAWRRMLTPRLGAEFAFYLYPVTNAERFNRGEITDFAQVGFAAPDPRTVVIRLDNPTPYLLNVIARAPFYPVQRACLERAGDPFVRGTGWTRPGRLVGNGPFTLQEWRVNDVLTVVKNPQYWDAGRVKLNGVRFFPLDNLEVEERAFRGGQLHKTYGVPFGKIDGYRRDQPGLLRVDPQARTQYVMFNCAQTPFTDPRVRRALGLAVDRDSLVKNVTRGDELPGFAFTPPGLLAGYMPRARLDFQPAEARRLLAEAGFPGGKGFPDVEMLLYTTETYRSIAEAIQQMWKRELNIEVRLRNEEWKVYLNTRTQKTYTLSEAGWTSTYLDPQGFLDLFVRDSPVNQMNWAHPDFDAALAAAARALDPAARQEQLQRAEAVVMDQAPSVPLCHLTRAYLLRPEVKGWSPNLFDDHPYKFVSLGP